MTDCQLSLQIANCVMEFWRNREKEAEGFVVVTDFCRHSLLSSFSSLYQTLLIWSSRSFSMLVGTVSMPLFQILLFRTPLALHVVLSLSTCLLLLLIPLLTLIIDPEMRYRLAACSLLRYRVQVPTEDY